MSDEIELATKANGREEEEELWDAAAEAAGSGETPDASTRDVIGLAHRAIQRFPELAERYRRFVGPAAVVSGALLALAGVAVARRLKSGQHPDQILQEITSDEIESAAQDAHKEHRRSLRALLKKIPRRGRKKSADKE